MSSVALVGVTASGKSQIALLLAEQRGDCEILSVDSMCVYRGMDIGTSKPNAAARAAVPHHLLDLVGPDEDFTVTRYQQAARDALEDIAARRRHALLVGGTGLYLRAVIDDLEIPGRYPEVVASLDEELEEGRATVEDLHARLAELDPRGAGRVEPANRRRVVRALEVTLGSGRPFSDFGPGLEAYPPTGVAQVGIALPPEEVDHRIAARFAAMIDAGLVEEVRALVAAPAACRAPPGRPSATARCWPTWRTGCRSRSAWTRPSGARGSSPAARPRGSAATPGSAGHRARVRPASCWWPPSTRTPEAGGCENGTVQATKHEGAGNDFLVVLDPDDVIRLSVAQVRLLTDRHRGVGGDGIIRVGPGRDGCDLSMELHNADGGEAEMSGNGIRCLAQAAVDAGLVSPPCFTVATAGGRRTVEYTPGTVPGWATARVDMGPARLGPDQPQEFDDRRARTVEVGNPHLVLLGPDTAGVDVSELGPKLQAAFEGGVNVEWITLVHDAAGPLLDFRVFERGAGETLACGTGSVAAAAAARSWGVVGADAPVRVRNPGGILEVTLGADEDATTYLAGPVRKVADVVVHPGMLS